MVRTDAPVVFMFSFLEGLRNKRKAPRQLATAPPTPVVHHVRVLLPLASVEGIAASLGSASSPLLEEERDSLRPAPIAQGTRPFRLHGRAPRSALAPDDGPVNPLQTDLRLSDPAAARRKRSAWRHSSASDVAGVSTQRSLQWIRPARYEKARVSSRNASRRNRASANCAW